MWYEILPSYMIMTVAMAVPNYALYGLHKYFNNNAYGRDLEERWDRIMFVRDTLLTGDAYKSNGLEVIPDEVPSKATK